MAQGRARGCQFERRGGMESHFLIQIERQDDTMHIRHHDVPVPVIEFFAPFKNAVLAVKSNSFSTSSGVQEGEEGFSR